MKRQKFVYYILVTMFLSLIIGVECRAESSANSTVFEYFSYITYSGNFEVTSGTTSNTDISNIKLIDEENHIYYVERTGRGSIGSDVCFSGSFVSPTAKIVSITDPVNGFEGNGLSELDIDYSVGYRDYEEQRPRHILKESCVIRDGNVFTTSPGSILSSYPNVYYITIKDGDKKTVCTVLVDACVDRTQYINDKDIFFYDGTNGKAELLADEYQFAQRLNTPSCINGIRIVGDPVHISEGSISTYIDSAEIENKGTHCVSSDVKSVRISRKSNETMTEDGFAFATGLNILSNGTAEVRESCKNSYWYYKNRTYSVKINNGEWMEVDDGCISPELVLKQGWNIISIVNMSKDWLNSKDRIQIFGSNFANAKARIVLVYKEEANDYFSQKQDDTTISEYEVYKAIDKWNNGYGLYKKYDVYEKTNAFGEKEKWVDLYSSSPDIWMKVITEDQEAKTEIDSATLLHGGFLLTLDPATQESIPIQVTSVTGTTVTEQLHINWIMSSTELQKLIPVKGGSFTEDYSKDNTLYYMKTDGDEITLNYQSSPNTTTEIYVEREQIDSVDDDMFHTITVNNSCHRVMFRIKAGNGDSKDYIVVMERGDSGISQTTKTRVGAMINKVIAGGFLKEAQEKQPLDGHWGTFKLASLGEEYLEGTLASDVTQYNYSQATSYAAAILQLVMIGENPYDYLGVNYVDKLVAFGPGYYGPYANNIWTLLALDAAGYPVDDTLVRQVADQVGDTNFDLDMRGWGLCALSNHMEREDLKEKVDVSVETIKQVQLAKATSKEGYEVTGAFENFWYTNQNIQSHACVVSGLTAVGIDVGSDEWKVVGTNGLVDPVSLFETYQMDTGKFIRTPDELNEGSSFNKDVIIALGDLYNGSNVWQRYALTHDRYNELLEEAESLLAKPITDEERKKELEEAYTNAEVFRSDEKGINEHGREYFTLQEAVFAITGEKPDVFQGTAAERNQVQDLVNVIDRIPDYDSLSYANREIILTAEEAFEALQGDERLEHYVTNYRKLGKEYEYIYGIDAFLDIMKQIKKVDLSKAAKVKAAREAYDCLSDKQKAEDDVVTKYENLLVAEEVIEACRTADNVIAVIDTLGQITTLDSRESIEGARASYEALDETQKPYVTNYERLIAAEKELQRLEVLEEGINKAAEVDKLINIIGSVNHNSGAAIMSAEEAYHDLEREEAKRLVSGYSYLTECRRIYDNLIRNEERQHAADQVDYYISRIEDSFGVGEFEVIQSNETEVRCAVLTARDQYDTLITGEDPDAASYVTGYNSLLHAEALLEFYDWQQTGTEFSSQDFKDNVSSLNAPAGLESEGKILIAFAMYDALSEAGFLDEEAFDFYQELCSRREELEYFQEQYSKVQGLVQKILSLGTIGLGSVYDINEACEEYNSLDTAQQVLIDPAYVNTLEQIVEQYDALAEENKDADRVENLIDGIGEPDLNVENKIQEVRQEYDALEDKSRVSNYLVLVNAEYRILELKKEAEDYPIASVVIERIKELGTVQLDDTYKVTSARAAYEALSSTQRKCVKNLSDLEAAEARIDALNKASVSLNFQNKEIHIGEYVLIKTVTSVAKANLTWRCSDVSIISFDEKTGKLTGLKVGQASVTVTLDNGNQASCKVIVTKETSSETDKENPSISLNRNKATLYTKGSGKTITLILKYNGKKVTGKKVKWKSSKISIAKISENGKITAKKKGKVTITATYKGKTVTCKIIVKEPTIKLNRKIVTLSLKNSKTFVLKAIVNGKSITGKKVRWKSNNRKIVTVSKSGKVTAKKKGKTKITARINGKQTSVLIIVR